MLTNLDKCAIAYEVCSNLFGVDIMRRERAREYIYARAVYYKLTRNHTTSTLQMIANFLKLHHATAIHSLREFEYMVRYDSTLGKQYEIAQRLFLETIDARSKKAAEESVDALKIRIDVLEKELKKLRLVEKMYLKEVNKKAVVYNEYLEKVVLL